MHNLGYLFTFDPGEKRLVSDIARRDPAGFIAAVKALIDAAPDVYRNFEFQKYYTVIRRMWFDFSPPPLSSYQI
jgi:hypothetical protein